MIKALYHQMKEEEEIRVPVEIGNATSNLNFQLFEEYYFGRIDENIKFDSKIKNIICSEEKIKMKYPLDIYKVSFSNEENCVFNGRYIAEGICFLLEKKCYKLNLDSSNPYYLSKKIWDYYLPDQVDNIDSFLDLSEFSLMHLQPCSVYIRSLKRIKKREIELNNLWEDLHSKWNVSSLENDQTHSFYESYFDFAHRFIETISGTLVSPIYKGYSIWLIGRIKKGISIRKNNKPIFSRIYEYIKQNLSGKEIIEKLINIFDLPILVCEEGALEFKINNTTEQEIVQYMHNSTEKKELKTEILQNVKGYLGLSFLSFISLANVFEFLKSGNKNCLLNDIGFCNQFNENHKDEKIEVDENCSKSPWLKNFESKCPFIAVLNTLGVKDKQLIFSTKS